MQRKISAIIPSLVPGTSDLALDRVLDPARFFDRPADVLTAPDLDLREKRAILSSWASDACAVESMPTLRKLPGAKSAITFDEIMDALRALDCSDGQDGLVSHGSASRHLNA